MTWSVSLWRGLRVSSLFSLSASASVAGRIWSTVERRDLIPSEGTMFPGSKAALTYVTPSTATAIYCCGASASWLGAAHCCLLLSRRRGSTRKVGVRAHEASTYLHCLSAERPAAASDRPGAKSGYGDRKPARAKRTLRKCHFSFLRYGFMSLFRLMAVLRPAGPRTGSQDTAAGGPHFKGQLALRDPWRLDAHQFTRWYRESPSAPHDWKRLLDE